MDVMVLSALYKGREKYVYKKNDAESYFVMNTYGSQAHAIKYAQAMERNYSGQSFATHNPCTKVHDVVIQLMGEDQVLNSEIKEKANEK